jgi:hypothetical protein
MITIADQIRVKALLTPAYRRELNDWEIEFIKSCFRFGLRTEKQTKKLREVFSKTRELLKLQGRIK